MNILLTAIDSLFTILKFAIIARALVSWLPIDRYHPAIQLLDSITEPILAPLRRVIPPVGMMDITPIVALILMQVIQALIQNALVGLSR